MSTPQSHRPRPSLRPLGGGWVHRHKGELSPVRQAALSDRQCRGGTRSRLSPLLRPLGGVQGAETPLPFPPHRTLGLRLSGWQAANYLCTHLPRTLKGTASGSGRVCPWRGATEGVYLAISCLLWSCPDALLPPLASLKWLCSTVARRHRILSRDDGAPQSGSRRRWRAARPRRA